MKRILLLLILIPTLTLAQEESPFDAFCEQAEKISAIAGPYMAMPNLWPAVVTTPAGPVPSILPFINENRNPMTEFCSFVNKLKYLKGAGIWNGGAMLANELTANQFSEEIGAILDLKDITDAVSQASRQGSLAKSASLHRRIARTMEGTYNVGRKHGIFSGESGSGGQPSIEQRGMRAMKMAQFGRNADKLSVLKSAINCSSQSIQADAKADAFYAENIQPLEIIIDEQDDEIEYAIQQLRNIGVRISGRYEEHSEYIKSLMNIKAHTLIYTRSEPRIKRYQVNSNGRMISRELPYYTYSYKLNLQPISDFDEKYKGLWKAYAKASTQTKGLFAKENNFIKEFRDLGFECRYNKFEWDVRKSNDEFRYLPSDDSRLRTEVLKKVNSCRESWKTNESQVDNLFSHYLLKLREAMTTRAGYDVQVFNYESEYLNINKKFTVGTTMSDVGEIAQTEVSCDTPLSENDQRKLQSDLQGVAVELKGQIAEEYVQKTEFLERRNKKAEEEARKAKEQIRINKEIENRKTWIGDDMPVMSVDQLKI